MPSPPPIVNPPPVENITYQDGLIALADGVRRYFQFYSVQASVLNVGLKYRSLWAKPRVVFIDGEFDGTNPPKVMRAGRLHSPDHMKSDNPRELVTWERVCTVSIFTVDNLHASSDEAQIQAVSDLLQWTLRAMWNAYNPDLYPNENPAPPDSPGGPGPNREFGLSGQASLDFDQGTVTRVMPPTEFAAGAELLVTFVQKGPLFDSPIPIVTATPQLLVKNFSNPTPS